MTLNVPKKFKELKDSNTGIVGMSVASQQIQLNSLEIFLIFTIACNGSKVEHCGDNKLNTARTSELEDIKKINSHRSKKLESISTFE